MSTIDYLNEIHRIERILASGARSITVDGVTSQVDVQSLRTELRHLKAQTRMYQGHRPVVSKINLRNI